MRLFLFSFLNLTKLYSAEELEVLRPVSSFFSHQFTHQQNTNKSSQFSKHQNAFGGLAPTTQTLVGPVTGTPTRVLSAMAMDRESFAEYLDNSVLDKTCAGKASRFRSSVPVFEACFSVTQ